MFDIFHCASQLLESLCSSKRGPEVIISDIFTSRTGHFPSLVPTELCVDRVHESFSIWNISLRVFSSVLSCSFIYLTGKEEENTNQYKYMKVRVDTEPGG